MLIGTLREIKNQEFRVGLIPASVSDYVNSGHGVMVESGAGAAINFSDEQYEQAGATIASREEIWAKCDLIIKVKEPLKEEYGLIKPGSMLYTYLHLADNKPLTEALLELKVTAIAYETIGEGRTLPCLAPMSGVAGRLAIIEGSKYLQMKYGGSGKLISGVPGAPNAKVVVLGGGVVGYAAARMALGMGASVVVLDVVLDRLREIDELSSGMIRTLYSNYSNIKEEVRDADIVVGSVLIPGAKTPQVLREEHIRGMKKGSVIVDVAIDQGGSVIHTHPSTHDDPIYPHPDNPNVITYSVANMPGAVAQTATVALTNATTPYGLAIANDLKGALSSHRYASALREGVNTMGGFVTLKPVATALNLPYLSLDDMLARG